MIGSLLAVAVLSVGDFGAVPDDGIDDTAAIQKAIDHGGYITIEPGVYDLSQTGYAWSLQLNSNLHLAGSPGSVFRMEKNTGRSVRLFSSLARPVDNVTISGLELDGNRSLQTVDPQRHAIFLKDSTRVVLQDLYIHGFTGDGVYLLDGCKNISLSQLEITDNGRNGVTLGGSVDNVRLSRSRVYDNAAQQFDAEGYTGDALDNVELTGNYFRATGDFAITLGGTYYRHAKGWRISDNVIESSQGAVRIIYSDDIVFRGNVVRSGAGPWSGVQVYNRNGYVLIADNIFNSPSTGRNGAVSVIATRDDLRTRHVSITGNTGVGNIWIMGAHHSLVVGNVADLVYLRATFPMTTVCLQGNIYNELQKVGSVPDNCGI